MELQFTRRDFLKGSIVVALGAAGAVALSSCGGAPAKSSVSASGTAAGSATADSSAATSSKAAKTVTLHRGYGAAHGDKCFTRAVVAMADDGTILGVSMDDYQFMKSDTTGLVPVPNSNKGFGEGCAEGQALASKSLNNDIYSSMMKEKAQSTTPWLTSMKAIESFCVGKKPSDLKNVKVDAVSGATLVDTPNYLKLVSEVAEDNALVANGSYTGEGKDVKFGWTDEAAHGDKAFANAVSLVQGDTVLAASIDDFQFMKDDTAGLVPVPNSDKGFGEGYAQGVKLASKSINSDSYSASMKEKAQSTTPWLTSMEAIEGFIAGKKISDVKANGPDAVSGATLVDTAGYVKAAADAAKLA